MKNFCLLADALTFIEHNLCRHIAARDIADAVHCSLSAMQKLFRLSLGISPMAYLNRRRLCLAARDIQNGALSMLDIAMKYQYNSAEVFTRAFARLWGVPPTEYRKQWRFSEIYPKKELSWKGDETMPSKRVDVSALYDELTSRQGGYVLCFDIQGLSLINELSRRAGDCAILTCLARIDNAATEEMMLFRVGGDEFALVTGLDDADAVRALARRVLLHNGECVSCDGRELPVSMWASAVRLEPRTLRYQELFDQLQRAVDAGKRETEDVAFL